MKRENGFYWIRETPYHNWLPAYYQSEMDQWWCLGERIFDIENYNKVGNKPILNPDQGLSDDDKSYLLEILHSYNDSGPIDEGWKSEEVVKLIARIESVMGLRS